MAYHRSGALRVAVVNRTVEQCRRALPVNQYLYMLHQGATTGYFPRLDLNGQPLPRDPDGKDDLSVGDRVKITESLLSKIMPDAKYDHDPDDADMKSVSADEVRTLSSEKLLRLLDPASQIPELPEAARVRAI